MEISFVGGYGTRDWRAAIVCRSMVSGDFPVAGSTQSNQRKYFRDVNYTIKCSVIELCQDCLMQNPNRQPFN